MADVRGNPIASSVWGQPGGPDGARKAAGGRRTGGGADSSAGTAGAGLDRDHIVRTAVALLDEEGAGGLSMRRLGERLGSGTTSVYWYVSNKDELLDLALDAVMGEVPLPEAQPADWQQAVSDYVHSTRDVMLRHSWLVRVIGDRPNIGPNSLRLAERLMALLEWAGFSLQDSARASSSLTGYAVGDAVSQASWQQAQQRSGLSMAELAKLYDEHFRGRYDEAPTFARWWKESEPLDVEAERDAAFDFGLRAQITGLAQLLPPAAAPSATKPRRGASAASTADPARTDPVSRRGSARSRRPDGRRNNDPARG